MMENTPSAKALKEALKLFYTQTGQLQRNMERKLSITFADRLTDLQRPDIGVNFVTHTA